MKLFSAFISDSTREKRIAQKNQEAERVLQQLKVCQVMLKNAEQELKEPLPTKSTDFVNRTRAEEELTNAVKQQQSLLGKLKGLHQQMVKEFSSIKDPAKRTQAQQHINKVVDGLQNSASKEAISLAQPERKKSFSGK